MAGYSETPLTKKLGIKPGASMLVRNEPEGYWKWISPLPEHVVVKTKAGKTAVDFVHIFMTSLNVYKKEVLQAKKTLHSDGMIWVSWPKQASKVPTDLNENVIRDFALANGLVDIKVCAVNEIWSGLKLVVPVKDRKKKDS